MRRIEEERARTREILRKREEALAAELGLGEVATGLHVEE
jgi:hypothetical protein